MATQDNSVQFALSELKRIENERLADEAKAARDRDEAKAREAAEALATRETAERHAREVAEAEVRLQVARELEQRDVESAGRLARLRAELDAVRADRERLHARATAAAHDGWAEATPSRSGRGWAAAFAAACVAMGVLVVVLATREPVVQERIVEVRAEAPRPSTPAEPEVAPVAAPAEVAATEPAPTTHRPRPRPRPIGDLGIDMESTDPLEGLDCPEDDPTCGI